MLVSDGLFDESHVGPRVLDLYAGSGALGFEALSRGARSVVFVEQARQALAAIRENTRALEVEDQVSVVAMRVDRALRALEEQMPLSGEGSFELVVIDPPYSEVKAPAFDGVLASAARLLAPTGILVVEHSSADEPTAPAGLHLDRRRKHGDTSLSLFTHVPETKDAPV